MPLEPVSLPRRVLANKARMTSPSYSARNKGDSITDNSTSYLNQSIRNLRTLTIVKALRALCRFNGLFSTAVLNFIQAGMSGYTVQAYNAQTGEYDSEGTKVAKSIIASLNTQYDYTMGYADEQSLDGLIETLLKEAIITGAVGVELVLNKFRLPEKIVAVPVDSLKWVADGLGGVVPKQTAQSGDLIDLNIPTFFYSASAQGADSIFPRPPLEAAFNTLVVFQEFLEDLSKAVRQSGHTRLEALIDVEKVANTAPADVRADPEKMQQYMEKIKTDLESLLTDLNPEDALVAFDLIKFDALKTSGEKQDYVALLESYAGLVATSLKSPPSTLGLRLAGSQSLSNTESLLYIKTAASFQKPVQTVMSRMLTLTARLLGADVYIDFKFNPIDLRPESELAPHRAVMQSLILEQLSLGMISDDEAADKLGINQRPSNAPVLQGTMFKGGGNAVNPNDISMNGGPQQRALVPQSSSN